MINLSTTVSGEPGPAEDAVKVEKVEPPSPKDMTFDPVLERLCARFAEAVAAGRLTGPSFDDERPSAAELAETAFEYRDRLLLPSLRSTNDP